MNSVLKGGEGSRVIALPKIYIHVFLVAVFFPYVLALLILVTNSSD
jgi:hypothetical protein